MRAGHTGANTTNNYRVYHLSKTCDLHHTCKFDMMADSEEAPPEVHHYENLEEVPWDIQK